MTIDQIFNFNDLFNPFGLLSPARDTRGNTPNGEPPPAHTDGGELCSDGKHQLTEIGTRQEFVQFPNKHGVMLEGKRDWVICKCEKCGVEERFIPLNVIPKAQSK